MQFLRYLTISSVAALVNLIVGFTFYSLLGLSAGLLYAMSVGIGYLTGMGVNWSLNRLITFPRSGRSAISEIRTFVVIASIGLLLTTVLAEVFRRTLAVHAAELIARFDGGYLPSTDLVAHAGAIAAVAVYSFLGHKWCTFDRGIRPFLSYLVSPKGERDLPALGRKASIRQRVND